MKSNISILILIVILFGGCKVRFTEEIREKYKAKSIPLKQIQFYNSKTIILHREVPKMDVITDSAHSKPDTLKIEEVMIKRNTPGICEVDSVTNQLEIRFETGDNRTLKFGLDPTSKATFYYVQALSWENHVGKVPYDNKMFNIIHGNDSKLKIKRKYALNNVSLKLRIAKGIEIIEKK